MSTEKSSFSIECKRLRLVSLREEFVHETLSWRNNDSVRVWFKNSGLISSEQHLRWFGGYMARHDDYVFVMQHFDGTLLGQLSIYGIDRVLGVAEVGRFITVPEFQGLGYFQEGFSGLANFAFGVMGLRSIFLEVFKSNHAALRAYERLGFRLTGELGGELVRMELLRPF